MAILCCHLGAFASQNAEGIAQKQSTASLMKFYKMSEARKMLTDSDSSDSLVSANSTRPPDVEIMCKTESETNDNVFPITLTLVPNHCMHVAA